MKKFLFEVVLFSLTFLAIVLIIFLQADGYTDAFYLRLTSPKQKSLILGTSRAAQGILPSVLGEELNRNDLYNYSFTVAHSSFGPVYYESIKRKLDTTNTDGLFIVAVDPWSISSSASDPDDISQFIENDKFLNKLSFMNYNPNIEYLTFHYEANYIDLFKSNKKMFLHEDGWLEVTTKMDYRTNNLRIEERVAFYRNSLLPFYKLSKSRLQYLLQTVEFLNQYGEVHLVRLPIHDKMMAIENQLMPNFDAIIKEVIKASKTYYDMTTLNSEMRYTDGNHLYKASGKVVTELIAHNIKAFNK